MLKWTPAFESLLFQFLLTFAAGGALIIFNIKIQSANLSAGQNQTRVGSGSSPTPTSDNGAPPLSD
jgi:hypothetical protein